MAFIYVMNVAIFAVGANITARKIKDKNVIMTNLMVGSIFTGGFTLIMCVLVDWYLGLMGVAAVDYRDFVVYSLIRSGLATIISMISQKLYYRNEIRKSNNMNVMFGVVDFILIVGLNMLIDSHVAIIITLVVDTVVTVVYLAKNHERWKFRLSAWNNIKNSSFEILDNLGMFVAYGVGFSHSFSYGQKYLDATNFETLITDSQWDMLNESLHTVAKVDVTENKFDYSKLRKASFGFMGILVISMVVMGGALYWYYQPDLPLLATMLMTQLVDMAMSIVYYIKFDYLQINDNRKAHNAVILLTRVVRVVCAFLPTGFCVYIGQLASTSIKYVYAGVVCRKFKAFRRLR